MLEPWAEISERLRRIVFALRNAGLLFFSTIPLLTILVFDFLPDSVIVCIRRELLPRPDAHDLLFCNGPC